ncbi:MAG: selenide, water dikinase SelD [Rhodospirillaceae bacterium]|nr:selenide, water dikinase SelD [Rhodospirillaceae bacterium]
MLSSSPVETDIVLVGGGHAHVEVVRRFGMKPEPGVRLTLVSTPVDTPYSGMLPGYLAGHYGFDDCMIDLRRLCRFAGARLIVGRACGIDRTSRQVSLADRPPLPYDLLSIDIGSVPETVGIGGAEHAVPLKPIPAFLERWAKVEALAEARNGAVRIVVIGAGAGGVEAAMALHSRMNARFQKSENKEKYTTGRLQFTILSMTPEILPGHAAGVRRRVLSALRRNGFAVETDETAAAIEPGRVLCKSGRAFEHDAAILVTQGAAAPWLRETGLDVDPRGFLKVGPTLQSVSDGTVFAAGDCAAFNSAALPKSGVYAVRQGPVLADNLRRAARGEPLQPFRPQRRVLALISLGDQRAVASKSVLASEGGWVWRWKDRIDRRWMARYGADLPAMTGAPVADPAAEAMRCGGCGAKVPQAILSAVLDRLRADPETSRTLALDSPDDAAPVVAPAEGALYQTVDQFRAFIDDPWLFGRIAANHCMGDIHAMGGAPVSALVSVTLPFAAPGVVERDLEQLLRGVLRSLGEAGAVLIGGHTAEGAEMAVGLTINGTVGDGAPWRKGGARPGDRLILTKALGTGVLLAAEMARAARGRDVETALRGMLANNGAAVGVLRRHGARGCTDVTGFGLGGHLLEMLEASGCGAVLHEAALPMLPGASDLLSAGHASTLHPANRAALVGACEGVVPEILADPQTAGGLLAAVPADSGEACVEALRKAGYPNAADIGLATEREAEKPAIRLE